MWFQLISLYSLFTWIHRLNSRLENGIKIQVALIVMRRNPHCNSIHIHWISPKRASPYDTAAAQSNVLAENTWEQRCLSEMYWSCFAFLVFRHNLSTMWAHSLLLFYTVQVCVTALDFWEEILNQKHQSTPNQFHRRLIIWFYWKWNLHLKEVIYWRC